MKCWGLPSLSVDGSIQTKRTRLLVALWGWHWRGDCEVALGFSKPAGLKEGGLLVQVLTWVAGVSSRTCRKPAPQTDAEADQHGAVQGSSQQYSVWSFLLEPSHCPCSYREGEKYSGEIIGNTWSNDLKLKGRKESSCYRLHLSMLPKSFSLGILSCNLKLLG